MKLNLGCGRKLFPQADGWVNVDLENPSADVIADVFDTLPFGDNAAAEVHAIHVLEHAYIWRVSDILKEWWRVLQPGGALAIEVPCFDKVIEFLKRDVNDPRYTFWPLYGDPSHRAEAMCHHWCFTRLQLAHFLKAAGFEEVSLLPAQFHVPDRDMRMEARKPAC